jgi:uncharacterized protein YndB with AHSA1/START domain
MNDVIARSLELALERTVLICAKRETVFRYFTDSARWADWWGTGSTIDARPGGALLIRYPNGETASGKVLEVNPPESVAFTYGYDAPGKPIPPGGSIVRITLAERKTGTLVTLRHEVDSAKTRDLHVAGWRFQLSLFSNVVAREQHAGLAAVADRWFDAWNAKDADARRRALDAAVVDEVSFRDAWACLSSRAELEEHVALIPLHMPGVTLRRASAPRQCQGTGAVDWEIVADADGAVRARGTNVFALAPDGRFARVVGIPAPTPS